MHVAPFVLEDSPANVLDSAVMQHTPTAFLELAAAVKQCDDRGVDRLLGEVSESDLALAIPEMDGATCLHLAISMRNTPVVYRLVDAGAPVGTVRDNAGFTPLQLSLRILPEVFLYILENGKNKGVHRSDPRTGRTLLHEVVIAQSKKGMDARLHGYSLLRTLLEEYHLDPVIVDREGRTALECAKLNRQQLGREGDAIIALLEGPEPSIQKVDSGSCVALLGIFRYPLVRLMAILGLAALHICIYLVHRRRIEERSAFEHFPYVFHILRLIFFAWPEHNSTLLVTKLLCILLGPLTAILVGVAVHRILRDVLRMEMFGWSVVDAQRTWRGILPLACAMALTGLYCGGLVYNKLLDEFHFNSIEQQKFYEVVDYVDLSRHNAHYVYLGVSLCVDSLLLVLCFDCMMQQLSIAESVPHACFMSFLRCLYSRWSVLRYFFVWIVLLGCCAAVGCFVGYEWLGDRLLSTNVNQRVAVSSSVLCAEAIVMLQEWTLPTMQTHKVCFPGFPFFSNVPWLLWTIVSCVLAIDIHTLADLLYEWETETDVSDASEVSYLAVCLLPAGVGAIAVVGFIVANSVKSFCKASPEEKVDAAASPRLEHRAEQPTLRSSEPTDIWSAAYMNDVEALQNMLRANPQLLDAKGGCGICCVAGRPFLSSAKSDRMSATPIHYAILGNAREAAQLLLAKGANARIRTTSGLYSAQELASLSGSSISI